jgi:DNA end-binding protein Ku
MARSIWSGSLSFGLVNVPVKLYSAIAQKDVHFHQFKAGTNKRVRNERVVEGTNEEVPYEDVVKGYEVRPRKWVMLTKEELEAVEPGRSRTIEIEDFVDLADVDPIYFEKSYYLGPEPDRGAERPYVLLRRAMEEEQRIGIARFVMRSKLYLAAIRPREDVLVLETLYFPDEVRDPAESIENLPKGVRVSPRELEAARRLIESLATDWDPRRYKDTYRERVLDLIEQKAKGKEIQLPEREEPAPVLDLMAALEARLEGKRGGRRRGAAPRASETRGDGATTRTAKRGRSPSVSPDLPKEELIERARKAGIAGRSKMSKDELVKALRRAG